MGVWVFFQAEGILRAWATPALQKDYGIDPAVTKIWNATMTEVRYLWRHSVTSWLPTANNISFFDSSNGQKCKAPKPKTQRQKQLGQTHKTKEKRKMWNWNRRSDDGQRETNWRNTPGVIKRQRHETIRLPKPKVSKSFLVQCFLSENTRTILSYFVVKGITCTNENDRKCD